jgi:UDP-N-acetylglucosamine--N-acetylmuramyl-(pentapeptide) pyrophosphoryl-undecaprenol N-acetylglucosamine transferase
MTGNPVREGIVVEAVRHREKMEEMAQPGNPASDGLTLLILGGSQGSVQLNEMAKGCIPLFPKIHWIIQCGEKSIESMRRDLSAVGDANVELFGYHSSIHELYARADLLISRSGAGILTEAAAFALPMILVPYPYAADDHQKENALVFVKAGAARIIDTREREAGALRVEIERLIGDAGALREMGLTSYRLARLDAAERIVKEIAEAR